MSANDPVLHELRAEAEQYEALLALLVREQDALRRSAGNEVEAIAHEKQAFLPPLADFARTRALRLRDAGYANEERGMQAWLAERAPKSCGAAWQRVRILIEQVQKLNQVNGYLIELQSRYFSLAIATLRTADGAGTLYYGADGRAQAARETRPSLAI